MLWGPQPQNYFHFYFITVILIVMNHINLFFPRVLGNPRERVHQSQRGHIHSLSTLIKTLPLNKPQTTKILAFKCLPVWLLPDENWNGDLHRHRRKGVGGCACAGTACSFPPAFQQFDVKPFHFLHIHVCVACMFCPSSLCMEARGWWVFSWSLFTLCTEERPSFEPSAKQSASLAN